MADDGLLGALLSLVDEEIDFAVALRRGLHAHPELGGEEHETIRAVAAALPAKGIPFAGTGLLVSVGDPAEDAVWTRAELDGLAITENTGVGFAARNGRMHACGHDVHLAALVALVRAAVRIESRLPARLVAVFQPSEERHPSGARALVGDPALTAGVKAAVAAHVHPDLAWGSVGVEPGPVNAACDAVHLVVRGVGGHAAYPHRTVDPVLAMAQVVVGLHGLIGRRVDPLHAATLTVGCVHAGSAENVVPESAEARITVRSLDSTDQRMLRAAVVNLVEHVAAAHGCTTELSFTKSEPPLVNDPCLATAARRLASDAGFSVADPWRSCGGDDFAHYGRVGPALMAFVGLREAPGFHPSTLHQADFLPPDGAVRAVARALALLFVAASGR